MYDATWRRSSCSPGRANSESPISMKSGRLWRVGTTAADGGLESEVIDNSIKD